MKEDIYTVRRIKILQALILYIGTVIFIRLFLITLKSPFSIYSWNHIRTILSVVLGSTIFVLATYKIVIKNIVQGTIFNIKSMLNEWGASTPLNKLIILITLLGIPTIIQNFKEWFLN